MRAASLLVLLAASCGGSSEQARALTIVSNKPIALAIAEKVIPRWN